MDDLISHLRPVLFKDGVVTDYAIDILKNGGLATRHLPTGQVVPHVLTTLPPGKFPTTFPQQPLPGPLAAGQALQMGMPLATLGVGLLNLGVSAWTAWKVHKIDKKLDTISDGVNRIDGKLDQIGGFLDVSMSHLDGLIRNNALMLGFIVENQASLGEGLALLRQEMAHGFRSVHEALSSAEARAEAQALQLQMHTLFRYYQLCSHEMQVGRQPPLADLRNIIDTATQLVAWLDTRLSGLVTGDARRLPFIVARVFALKLEIEARTLLDSAPQSRQSEYMQQRALIRDELLAITEGAPLLVLAQERSLLVEQYVFLHRSIQGNITLIEHENGHIQPYCPSAMLIWDDGLQSFRDIAARPCDVPAPQTLELQTLEEHRAWQRLAGLPRGSSPDEVPSKELALRIGLSGEMSLPEDGLMELLRLAPDMIADNRSRLMKEFM